MAPKTATKAAPKVESKKSYKDMITIAITTLKDRLGSSRQSIKKYIASKFSVGPNFDSQFNLALSRGVKAGDFVQPKGSSGPVKLAKKEKAVKKPVAAAPKKPVAKKLTPVKKTSVKSKAKKVTKPAPKKAAPKKKTVAPKKKVAPTKKAAPKKTKKSKK